MFGIPKFKQAYHKEVPAVTSRQHWTRVSLVRQRLLTDTQHGTEEIQATKNQQRLLL